MSNIPFTSRKAAPKYQKGVSLCKSLGTVNNNRNPIHEFGFINFNMVRCMLMANVSHIDEPLMLSMFFKIQA